MLLARVLSALRSAIDRFSFSFFGKTVIRKTGNFSLRQIYTIRAPPLFPIPLRATRTFRNPPVPRITSPHSGSAATSVIVLLATETAVELVCRRPGLAEGRRPKRLVINLLVDFLHSCRIFRCSRGVSLDRFGSEGEEFFETTRRKSSEEAHGLIREIRKGMRCHFGHVSHIAMV